MKTMPENNPIGFRNVSVHEDLYRAIQKFLEANEDELRMRRIRNPAQLVDASARCFITCGTPVSERRI